MAAHRKFTFPEFEDSYWNGCGPSTSIFDDAPSTSNVAQAAARAALEDLFTSQVNFGNDDASSTTGSEAAPTENGGDGSFDARNLHAIDAFSPLSSASSLSRQRASSAITPSGATVGVFPLRHQLSLNAEGREFSDVGRGLSAKSAASIVSESSVGSFSNESTTQLDYSRLKSEHRKLQKHLEQVRHERYRAAEADVTVRRLAKGEPVALDFYRSRKQKMELLDAALDSLDGNAIIAVILFLRRSLAESIFREILLQKSIAADHYVAFLKETEESEQLVVTLFALGRNDEAAMVEFSLACKRRAEQRAAELKKCLVSGFSDPLLTQHAKLVNEYVDLLERQIPIDAADDSAAKSGKEDLFVQFPKSASLVGQPLLTTLYYCCLYHYDLPMNSFASPLSVREVFQLNEKQFAWIAIKALSRLKRWSDVERVLMSRKLLGGCKLVCPFSWHHLFRLVTAHGPPPKDILCKLLRAVPDTSERKQIAEQYPETNEVVVECLVAQRDRLGLSALLSRLTPHTTESYKAINALNTAGQKWKN